MGIGPSGVLYISMSVLPQQVPAAMVDTRSLTRAIAAAGAEACEQPIPEEEVDEEGAKTLKQPRTPIKT